MPFTYTSQRAVRRAFWEAHEGQPGISRKRIRKGAFGLIESFNTDTGSAFSAFVDQLARAGDISEDLAFRVTLGA